MWNKIKTFLRELFSESVPPIKMEEEKVSEPAPKTSVKKTRVTKKKKVTKK